MRDSQFYMLAAITILILAGVSNDAIEASIHGCCAVVCLTCSIILFFYERECK